MPPRPSFRHAFAHRFCTLDPIAYRLSPELKGHVPFVNFCNVSDPRARPTLLQTPPTIASTVWWMAPPLRVAPAGWPQLRGLKVLMQPLNPRLDVRTAKRIYPNLLGPDTSCHPMTPIPAWKNGKKGRPYGNRPLLLESQRAKPTVPKPDEPLRAAFHCCSRKRQWSAAPEVPSTFSPDHKDLRRLPTSFGHPAAGWLLTRPL